MSSFGNDIICKNIQCNTVNGNAPTGGSTKWQNLPGGNDIERTVGDVYVNNLYGRDVLNTSIINFRYLKNVLNNGTAQIEMKDGTDDSLIIVTGSELQVNTTSGLLVNGAAEIIGKTELVAKLGTQDILYLGGPRLNNTTYIDVNTAEIDLSNPATIYLIQMKKKPDKPDNQFFRINMKGDIIGCNDIMDCNDIGCNDIECSSVQIENKIDYSKCKKGLIESGQGMRILKFDTSFINYFNFTLSPADPNVSDGTALSTKFKIQHSDANVNNVIGTEYIVRLSSFNVTGTDFNILATVNVLAPNDLELYMTSTEFLTNGLQLRFLMELIPINFS